jgi:hypothetical protein
MEFVWKAEGFGNKGIFVHVLSNHYNFPSFVKFKKNLRPDSTRCFKKLPATDEEMEKW